MNKKEKEKKIDIESLNEILSIGKKISKVLYIVIIASLIVLGIYILKEFKVFTYIGEILKIISPVFIGFVIAWLFDPLVKWFQKKKIPKVIGCIISYLIIFLVIFLVLYSFFPNIVSQLGEFVKTIPDILKDLKAFSDKLFSKMGGVSISESIYQTLEKFIVSITTELPTKIIAITKSIISFGLQFSLGLIIGFYLLFDYDKVNKTILNIIPDKWIDNYQDLTKRINTSLRKYVQGVLLIMLIMFITQTIALSIIGLKTPMLFALFCAVTDIIPYFGPYIGAIPAVIVGFTMSPMTGILTIVAILIVQTLENNVYQPLIMGHTMKLHPVVIMLCMLISQHFFGILGMILSTPILSCLKVIFNFTDEKIKEKLNTAKLKV